MEPLIDPLVTLEPAQIPHHKGRKRMHLEVKESIKKVSTEVKQKLVDAVSALSNTLQRRDSANSDQANSVKAQVSLFFMKKKTNFKQESIIIFHVI